jgi:hypothetical protein
VKANPDMGRRLMAMVLEMRAAQRGPLSWRDPGDPYEAGYRAARVRSACDAMQLAALALGHDICADDDAEVAK